MAGTLRLQYPANVFIIRVPCSGRVEEEFILRAFADGADGVVVAGCLEGNCHYVAGNIRAARRVRRVRGILAELGLEVERLEMCHISASQGKVFANFMTDFVARTCKLGPALKAACAPALSGGRRVP